jgi:hypothetical protein
MANHANTDENIIVELKQKADAKGISLWRAFQQAGQDPNIVTRWRKKEPKAVTVVREVEKVLAAK